MALDSKKLKELHEGLKKCGYTQDYDTFVKGFTGKKNYSNRKRVYDILTEQGARIGKSYEEFMQKMQVGGRPSLARMARDARDAGMASLGGENPLVGSSVRESTVQPVGVVKQLEDVKRLLPRERKGEEVRIERGLNEMDQKRNRIETLAAQKAARKLEMEGAEAELGRINELLSRRRAEIDDGGVGMGRDVPRAGGWSQNTVTGQGLQADTEYLMLQAAGRNVENRMKTLKAMDVAGQNSKWADFWNGFKDQVGNLASWDNGYSDLQYAKARGLSGAGVARSDGEREAERLMLSSELKLNDTNRHAQGLLGEYRGYGGTAGASVPFMADMLLGGAVSLSEHGVSRGLAAVAKEGLKAGAEKMGKAVAEKMGKGVLGKVGKMVGAVGSKVPAVVEKKLVKALGVGVKDLAMSAEMAVTVQGQRTGADVLNRVAGDHVQMDGKTGQAVLAGGKGVVRSLYEGLSNQVVENYTERLGEHMPSWDVTKRVLPGLGLNRVSAFFTSLGEKPLSKMTKELWKKAGWNGLPNEILEEEAGIPLHAMTDGSAQWGDLVDEDKQRDICMGMLFTSAFVGSATMALQAPVSAANMGLYYRDKHELSKADRAATRIFGGDFWKEIKERIDHAENRDLPGVLSDVLSREVDGRHLNVKEAFAVKRYVGDSVRMRGHNMGQLAAWNTGKVDEVVSATDGAYADGYETRDGEQMHDVKLRLQATRSRLARKLGIAEEELDERVGDPVDYLHRNGLRGLRHDGPKYGGTRGINDHADVANLRSGVQDDGAGELLDYANAKAAYAGMIDRVRNDIESTVEESDADVEARTHRGDGVIYGARMASGVDGSDRRVFVVDGDVSASEGVLVVRDAETGVLEMVAPSDLLSIDAPLDANVEKVRLGDEIRQGTAQREAERVDGVLGFAPGDVYSFADAQGVGHVYEVLGDARDEKTGVVAPDAVLVRVDGSDQSVVMPKSELERMNEAADMARLEAWLEDGSLQDGDVSASEGYSLYDELVLRDDDGNAVGGTITSGENADGKFEVETERPINGKRVNLLDAGELDALKYVEADGGAVSASEGEKEDVSGNESALGRVPLDQETGEPMFERVDKQTALDALGEVTGGNDADTTAIVNAQLEQAQKALDVLKKKRPIKKAPALKGSPMAMVRAQREAEASYNAAVDGYNVQVAQAEERLSAWTRIFSLMNERRRRVREGLDAEQRVREAELHDAAVAELEAKKRRAAQKAVRQGAIGAYAVDPKIKEKWDGAEKVDGNSNVFTLSDGSTIRGRYVLTEAGSVTASHDVNNGFEPTEGFPIDENGQSVNDRDYKRDADAQRMVREMADNYDSRALQFPVIVSGDGVVLSGNNRTMSGDIAAERGTDGAYIDYLREFGGMYGFTPEQMDGMKHPRVVFVLDEVLPYDATTFARFNAEGQKRQSKPEQAVKLGKIVPDDVFTSITNGIGRFDRLSDYYADQGAVDAAIGGLLGAGVINEMQLPELRTGHLLSAAGKELIENVLIGKVFESWPDAVRQIIGTPVLRQSVIMGLGEIAHNRLLARSGYDLSEELGGAIDLVARAKQADADIYKEGVPVSPFGRERGLFDDEYGDSRVTDGIVLLLADVLNSGRPSDLRKVLSVYNAEAMAPAGGQLDMFTGDIVSKEDILKTINEYFRDATPKEQQSIVDAAVAERKQRAAANSEAGDTAGRSEGSANQQGVGGVQEEARNEVANQAMSHDEAIAFIATMESRAEVAPSVDLSIENWDALFGKDGVVNTPIGEVKMGEDQFTKMMRENRHGKLGMVKPTLENPDAILEDASKAKEGDAEERPSSYIFVKAFKKSDGSRYYYFTSVTVSKEGREVVVSNQEKRKNAIANLLSKDKLVWKHADDVSDASDVAQGLYSWQGNVSDLATEGTDAPQTSMSNIETSEPTNSRTDVDSYLKGKSDDTATRQNSDVSVDKVINKPLTLQENGEESVGNKGVTPLSEGIAEAHVGLNDDETNELLSRMEGNTSEIPQIELNPTNWIEQFGENGMVATPVGEVKMGENQIAKLFEKGRSEQFGMIKPTLENPQVVIEVPSEATDDNTERASSLLFIKTFKKEDGTKVYYFKSVTVKKDGLEVSVSSHYDHAKRVREALKKGKLLYRFDGGAQTERHPADVSVTTSPESMQGKEGNTLQTAAQKPHGGVSSESKVNGSLSNPQKKSEKVVKNDGTMPLSEKIATASANVNTEPTEAQKGAGHYKRGRVQVGGFDETVAHSPAKAEIKQVDSRGYSITPSTYTNKRGKRSDVWRLTFDHDLRADQGRAVKEFAKERIGDGRFAPARGWRDRESGGWMFRNEEDARRAAELVGDADAVAENQPLSVEQMRDAIEPKEKQGKMGSVAAKVEKQVADGTLRNDTEAKRLTTEAVLEGLNRGGIPVELVSDEQAAQMLGKHVDAGNGVLFDEKDLEVTDHVQFMKRPSGRLYGWTVGGKIYLTKDGLNPNTPIHEYTHLWAEAMKECNPVGWQDVKALLLDTPVWKEVLADKNYEYIHDDADAVASEVLSRISGKKNAEKMEAEAEKMIDEAKDRSEKARAVSLLDRMKKALEKFWSWVGKDLLGIKKFSSVEEVTDRVLYDFVNGTELRSDKQGDKLLVAVHNISEDKLKDAFELGGLAMPSIAITKADIGHTGFGEISLIFDKSSIDPSDRRNKVYSGDAWTPTFPEIDYKLNDGKTKSIYRRANNVGDLPMFRSVDFDSDNYARYIDGRGAAGLVEHFKDDYSAKQMYLSEKGNAVENFVEHRVEKYSKKEISLYKKVLDKIGIERLKNEGYDLLKGDLEELVAQHYGLNVGQSTPFSLRAKIKAVIRNAVDYSEHGNSEIKKDFEATRKEIDERINDEQFTAWLEELFSGIVEKKGIRNERDMFTSSGNRRGWEKLYDAVTLDNVVKFMQREPKRGGEGLFNSSIFGASAKALSSMEDIRREAKSRINSISDENLEKEKDRIVQRLNKIILPSADKGVSEVFDFIDNVNTAVSKSHDARGIYKNLRGYYPDMTMNVAKEIAEIVSDIQKMSTKYFEAKPYRAIGFDEVRVALVPEGVSQDILDGLRQRGIEVRTYEKGNERARQKAVSSVTKEMGIRFQIVDNGMAEEEGDIIARAKEDGSYMKAPNGEPTKLTDRQWVQVRGKAFKKWFGDWESSPEEASKFVDENGEPKVFYHNTNNSFSIFDESRNGSNTDGWLGDGFYFYGNRNEGDGSGDIKLGVFLNVREPYYVTREENDLLAEENSRERSIRFREDVEEGGYDGVYYDGDLRQEAVVFDPDQIKSATENNGDFSDNNDDIRYREGDEEVNEQFNRELAGLTEENADTKVFNLGSPSWILLSAGVEDGPMKLYGNKVIKKMKKHGFALGELRDLPKAVADPIAVFDNYKKTDNRSILTELKTKDGNFLVSLTIGKGIDVDFNIIASAFGKANDSIVKWINKGFATYINKEKALNYLYLSAPIAEAAENSELSSAANMVNNFVNPNIGEEKNSLRTGEAMNHAMREVVNEVAARLHTPVRIIGTQEQVAALPSVRQRRMKGSFNSVTGEVTIVLPNHGDVGDVVKTVLHEVVGHDGLRVLFAEEGRLNNALDELYRVSSEGIRQSIDRMAERMYAAEVDRLREKRGKQREAKGEQGVHTTMLTWRRLMWRRIGCVCSLGVMLRRSMVLCLRSVLVWVALRG